MDELSRMIIEKYCLFHDTEKSRRLEKLVELSYDINAEASDSDAVYLEKAIRQEKDPELREALRDLDEFLFGY